MYFVKDFYMSFTSDIFFNVYPFLSLKDSSSFSQVTKGAYSEYKSYLKRRGYTPTILLHLCQIFKGWKQIVRPPKRICYNNSWRKSPKDPERPILLF